MLVFRSSDRQLLFCGMHSGCIRVYPLQSGDHSLTSMQAYWALSVHDNEYGHLWHICCGHDDHFVLTAGDDGNIFSFSLLPPEELQKSLLWTRARVPSPRVSPHFISILWFIIALILDGLKPNDQNSYSRTRDIVCSTHSSSFSKPGAMLAWGNRCALPIWTRQGRVQVKSD